MDKRSWGSYNGAYGGSDEKRAKTSELEDSGAEVPLEAEFYMEQRLVGWIIGRGGGTLKEVEQVYSVKVSLDQSTKEQGFSKLKVSGPATMVQQAAEHMNTSLARAVVGRGDMGANSGAIGPFLMDTPPGVQGSGTYDGGDPTGADSYEELHIEQKFVGWLLGKSGSVIREIETSSGCKISLNQSTRNMGYTVAQLRGSSEQRQMARQLMEASLDRAKSQPGWDGGKGGGSWGGAGGGCAPSAALAFGGSVQRWDGGGGATEELMQVEQRWVGWLLGKGGQLCKEIEQESGAKVSIDQSTKSLGYSTVRIAGEAASVEAGKARVLTSLQKVGGSPLSTTSNGPQGMVTSGASMQVQVDQQWVGWLLGKGGTVVKEIEQAAGGAKVSINQESKGLGYSIATITGNQQQISAAFEQMADKLRRVNPSGDGLIPMPMGAAGAAGNQLGGMDRNDHAQVELQIEQKWVGWLLGSGGKTIREIEAETGCKISIDQSFKDMGFSTVRVSGSSMGIQMAQQRIQGSLSLVAPGGGVLQQVGGPGEAGALEAAAAGLGPNANVAEIEEVMRQIQAAGGAEGQQDSEMQVEQKCVGWLLGKSGIVLKEIEMQSGASIKIDQSTRDMGYSTVRIVGNWQTTANARQLIQDKIGQAHPGGARQ